jgi:hypothetical protein
VERPTRHGKVYIVDGMEPMELFNPDAERDGLDEGPEVAVARQQLGLGEVAAYAVRQHVGGELDVDGDTWRTEAYRHKETADQSAATWRANFESRGWRSL